MDNPDLFCHVSLRGGIYRMPRAIAERAGLKALGDPPKRKRTASPKRRTKKGATPRKPRVNKGAVTPATDSEASASDETEETE